MLSFAKKKKERETERETERDRERQREKEGNPKVLENLNVVFVATELPSDNLFNNVKAKSSKDLKNFKLANHSH